METILGQIVLLSQNIGSEARWLEFYCHSQTEDKIGVLENCVQEIENELALIKINIARCKEMG
jgi:hypothetical protein